MSSPNLTWSNVLSVRETVIYKPSVFNPASITDFSQEAKITALCGGWQKIKNKVEEASVERFSQNAIRGREGFEAVLEMSRRVFSEQRELNREKLQIWSLAARLKAFSLLGDAPSYHSISSICIHRRSWIFSKVLFISSARRGLACFCSLSRVYFLYDMFSRPPHSICCCL